MAVAPGSSKRVTMATVKERVHKVAAMAFLPYADPEMKHYIKIHSIPQIYEALLTGLFVQCPDDPLVFLEEKIKELQNQKSQALPLTKEGHLNLSWDMFITPEYRQSMTKMIGSYLNYLFELEAGEVLPPEVYKVAYQFYLNFLLKKYFCEWMNYIRNKRKERIKLSQDMNKAQDHYVRNKLKMAFDAWLRWIQIQRKRHALAMDHIRHVNDQLLAKLILREWNAVTKEAKRTREYFEKLERGELEDETDILLVMPAEEKDRISGFPLAVSLKIFSYLGIMDLARCAQVCQSWKVITQTSSLWSKLDFYPVRKWIKDDDIANILRRYRSTVIHLSLRGCNNIGQATFKGINPYLGKKEKKKERKKKDRKIAWLSEDPHMLHGVLSGCRNLQDLNLSECKNVTDEFMSTVIEMCTSLVYLNMAYTTISDATLRTLSKFGLNLQYLSLAYSKLFTNKGLNYLATGKGCHKLVYLDISGCTEISVRGFKSLGIACNKIEHLVINDMATLTTNCITAMVDYYNNLTTVTLLGSPHISDTAIKALVQGSKLTTFKTEGNKRITDTSFKIFSTSCPNLNHIYVADCSRITDNSLKFISTLKNIIVLNISDCMSITDAGIRSFLEGASGQKLRELNISNCILITDLSLLKIAQRCLSLTHLRMRYCLHVTDSGIEWLGSLPTLTNIDLTGTNVQEQSLSGLSSNHKIKELTVAKCSGVTDNGLQKFYHKMHNLEYLDISHCLSVSDKSVKTLAFCCRRLISLNIAGCPKKGCKKLRILNMLYCSQITKQTVKATTNIQQLEYSDDNPPVWFGYDDRGNLLVTKMDEDESN
ncbi:F-box and leucine-rich repeat protein 13 isoform X3 [Hypanus sabinus]|uniref:F-box and leucine-rich repeat protein 13 isoform X3 n=1 Tax=Hypanus sabinus TaxID=79690 RepID=UPI0028C4A863|nr:F-box and leucine-rich repeat protein 13 isoform X3 [Hypanus sabinus]